ncbi:Decaprenyl diphosphate synthase-like protein [Amanita rubescens]|nr:Decaprenyl diphosphate synthase-like protein [Amanita rubescens]
MCLRLGVKCVSVYAFSIENFKRSKEEVDALMNLAEEKLEELCRHGDLLEEYGVRLNVIGKTELLPESVQRTAQKAESITKHNNRAILNILMPYTARDEIATAAQSAVHEALLSSSSPDDPPTITEHDITSHLMITRAGSPPLDILVRTSGVKRLSDFMLWQCCENTQIHFSNAYWPEYGFWDFVPVILAYQRKVWSRKV